MDASFGIIFLTSLVCCLRLLVQMSTWCNTVLLLLWLLFESIKFCKSLIIVFNIIMLFFLVVFCALQPYWQNGVKIFTRLFVCLSFIGL